MQHNLLRLTIDWGLVDLARSEHTYLTVETLHKLFNVEEERDFFTITSLEGILGETGVRRMK
jgi:hypothetical protein